MRKKLVFILMALVLMVLVPSVAFAGISLNQIGVKTPGSDVTISGSTTLKEVNIKVVRPNNTNLYVDVVYPSGNGTFNKTFTIPPDAAAGTYTVVAGEASDVDTKTFTVQAGSSGSNSGGGGSTPTQTGNRDDNAINNALKQGGEANLSLLNRTDAMAAITPGIVKSLVDANKSLILENKGLQVTFAPRSLMTAELNKVLQDKNASLELGARVVSAEEKQQIFAKAPLGESTGLFEIGGKVVDLTAQIKYKENNITKTENIASFSEPVAVTIDMSDIELSQEDIKKLTGIRYEKDAAGNIKLVKLGGTYDAKTRTFTFYTDRFSFYGVLKASHLINIYLTVDKLNTTVNGLSKTIDVAPTLINNRTMVPIRFVSESMGAKVDWEDATGSATITLDGKELKLVLNRLASGLDTPPVLVNGRILVPIRYVSESLGANVMWFPATNGVQIVK
ncbi:MAG: stalk domain-containing protein [Bacillota bacterium]|nr:stalk domain-containing protein [Bacillota bacterium]